MRTLFIAISLLCMMLSLRVEAQAARRDAGGSAQLVQQMQQMAAERTQLQAENARMKKELDDLRKERDGLRAGKESNDKRAHMSEVALAHAAQEREQGSKELDQLKDRTQELVTKFRETIQELRTVETDRTKMRDDLAVRDTQLKSCVNSNVALYKLNDEVLDKFEARGFWTNVARAEPFTRLKRVELENLADGYRDRADDAKVAPPATSSPGG